MLLPSSLSDSCLYTVGTKSTDTSLLAIMRSFHQCLQCIWNISLQGFKGGINGSCVNFTNANGRLEVCLLPSIVLSSVAMAVSLTGGDIRTCILAHWLEWLQVMMPSPDHWRVEPCANSSNWVMS